MGVAVWPMIDLEADDALASAARSPMNQAGRDGCIWTPDKDLAQCAR
jgi:5'-3' exonuclease